MSKIFAKAFLLAIIVCMFCATNLVTQKSRSAPLGVRDVAPHFTLVGHHEQKTAFRIAR